MPKGFFRFVIGDDKLINELVNQLSGDKFPYEGSEVISAPPELTASMFIIDLINEVGLGSRTGHEFVSGKWLKTLAVYLSYAKPSYNFVLANRFNDLYELA